MASKRSTSGIARPEFVTFFTICGRFPGLLGIVALLLPAAGYTQSLDEAVIFQLKANDDGRPCDELRGSDPLSSLTGQLNVICRRSEPTDGVGTSNTTGGGTATPTVLPSIIQQRLREARDKRKQSGEKVSAASADTVFKFGQQGNFFVFAEDQKLDRNVTALEDGFNSKVKRVTAGVDASITKSLIAGVAFDGSWQNLNFNGGGHSNVQSYGGVGYGAFRPTDRLSAQFYSGYDHQSIDRQRTATFSEVNPDGSINFPALPDRRQAANYGADAYKAGILVGYDHPIANVTISPFAAVDWTHTKFGRFSETGTSGLELTFHGDRITLLQSNLGVRASVALRVGSWTLVPQASASWKHEFENDQRNVEVSFVDDLRSKRFTYQTNVPDRNWGEINAGLIAVLPNGIQAFGNYRTIVGNSLFDSRAVMASLRIPF